MSPSLEAGLPTEDREIPLRQNGNSTGAGGDVESATHIPPETAPRSGRLPLAVEDHGGTAESAIGTGGTGDGAPQTSPPRVYITGWRLYILSFSLCLSLFLSALETTIVSTSLVSITNALGGFSQRDWVVTSYLLTYTGFLVIYAKFSDILGRKPLILLAIALFTIFSIVCGSGMGASGIYAMTTVVNPELVPPAKWGTYVGIVSLTFVLSSALGPILGGIINDHSSWRWVFLLNAPVGAIATALVAFFLPNHFPHQGDPERQVRLRDKFSRASLARLDVLGAFLLLAASILLVFGFEEAGSRYPWSSPAIIATLSLGGALFISFIGWEKFIEGVRFVQEPIFPLRLMKNRPFVAMALIAFFTGPPFMTAMINLPQRFQAVDGDSPFQAGLRLLPLLLCSPVATAVSGQVLGIGLASSVGVDDRIKIYGYEVIMGCSFGTVLVTLLIYVPMVVDRSDMAVSMGAVTQIRVLGGTIGLAISATVLNNSISSPLAAILTPSQLKQIADSVQFINTLPSDTRDEVRKVFSDGYSQQLRVMMYFSIAVLLFTPLFWERRLRRAKDVEGY